MASVARASFSHGVVVTGAGGATVSCLLGEGRPEPPSLFEAVWNSSVESSIMARRGDGGLLWVELMKAMLSRYSWDIQRRRRVQMSEPSEHPEESMLQNSLPGTPIVCVFAPAKYRVV
jgi:hypothetical protein